MFKWDKYWRTLPELARMRLSKLANRGLPEIDSELGARPRKSGRYIRHYSLKSPAVAKHAGRVPLCRRENRKRVVEVEQQVKSAKGKPTVEFMIDGEVYEARQRATKHPSGQFRERT
jgi:hypothetical protein